MGSGSRAATSIQIAPAQRWELYYRLRSLDIPCQYATGQPLTVRLDGPVSTLLCWSVLQQMRSTRADAIAWLERCWQGERT